MHTTLATAPATQLLGTLYDAVMAPAGFQSFVDELRQVCRLKAVTLIVRNLRTQEVKGLWISGLDPVWLERYALDYGKDDMLAQHIAASPIGHFYASNLHLPPHAHTPSHRFVREWLVPQGVAHAAGAVVLKEDAWLTEIIFQRTDAQGGFAAEEIALFDDWLPHLRRSIQMRHRFTELQLGQSFLAGGFDLLAMPTLLINERGQVAHCNRSASVLLGRGGLLRLEEQHLRTDSRSTTLRLGLEMTRALQASRGQGSEPSSVLLLRRRGQPPLMVMLAALRAGHGAPVQGAALLFIFDPMAAPQAREATVRRLFSLTDAEAALAVALCSGKSLQTFAVERGTSIHTARTQLKSLFTKTGARRQSELVSMVVASPAFFIAPDEVDEAVIA